jgi:hypothetical protein
MSTPSAMLFTPSRPQPYQRALLAVIGDELRRTPEGAPFRTILLGHRERLGRVLVPMDGPTGKLAEHVATAHGSGVGCCVWVVHETRCSQRLVASGRCRCQTPRVLVDDRQRPPKEATP